MAGNNNNNKKKRQDFFTQNIKQYGEDFLDYLNPNDLQVKAIQIFRQLARKDINVNEHGEYFLEPQFMEACIQAANSKYLLFSISYSGVNCLINTMMQTGQKAPTEYITILDYNKKCAEAYSLILQGLNAVKITGDTSHLIVLANQLSNYRGNI